MQLTTNPLEKINQRRRQIHVHSVLYYHLDQTIIDDATFDRWSNELVVLMRQYPEFKHKGYKPSLFADWTGDTGMHLPVQDDVLGAANWLLDHVEQFGHLRPHTTKNSVLEGDVGHRRES